MVVYLDKDVIVIEKTCPFCGKRYEGSFPSEGYGKWMGGELIQKAMPTVPATSREWLISGICPECQEKVFWGGGIKYEELVIHRLCKR